MKPTQEEIDAALILRKRMNELVDRGFIKALPTWAIDIDVIYSAYRAKCEELEAMREIVDDYKRLRVVIGDLDVEIIDDYLFRLEYARGGK